MEPNLSSQVAIADASLTILGAKLNVSNEVKPLLDRTVNEQVAALQARVRDDPFLEVAARGEWTKMCRSIALGAAAPGMPNLWLEVRPTRAFAAQPRINESALMLTIGVQAETRILPNATKPDCPFPAQLELVPQTEQGRVNIAVPIDVPFTEVNRLLEAQLKGKTFPDDKSSAFTATVQSVNLAASGDRLLISLHLKANENKSWFGLGAEATVHVWGRPVLDRERQMLRLNDVALDVELEAAFGLLGAAARAAVPYLEKALAENAVLDLVPLAANARQSIERAIADFRKNADGVNVEAAVTDLRLAGVEFDARDAARDRGSRGHRARHGDEAGDQVRGDGTQRGHGRTTTAAPASSLIGDPSLVGRHPLVHVHHERHGEQRRGEIDDRYRYEGGNEHAGDKDRAAAHLAQPFGFGHGLVAHGRQLEIFATEQVSGGQEKNDDAQTADKQERHRDEIDQDREQSRPRAFEHGAQRRRRSSRPDPPGSMCVPLRARCRRRRRCRPTRSPPASGKSIRR